MTAYTFDQPDVVDSLIRRPGVARLLVDRGQSVGERTKLQRQSLLQVARAGIRVRLTAGSSIAEAYAGDRRGTAVGKSFKGIQHSKTFCRRGAEGHQASWSSWEAQTTPRVAGRTWSSGCWSAGLGRMKSSGSGPSPRSLEGRTVRRRRRSRRGGA